MHSKTSEICWSPNRVTLRFLMRLKDHYEAAKVVNEDSFYSLDQIIKYLGEERALKHIKAKYDLKKDQYKTQLVRIEAPS
jgi:16S rRNA C1402 N4-methylase RsmH